MTENSKTLLWLLSIVSRDMGTVWIIYVLFREPITNGVWTHDYKPALTYGINFSLQKKFYWYLSSAKDDLELFQTLLFVW